jgi:predicted ATPase
MVTMTDPVFLTRVVLKNYKSIANCSVKLGPLNFLVGPNGAGKSNFVDALRFVTEALNMSLDQALRERGGIAEIGRRFSGPPTHLGIRLEYLLSSGHSGHYAFRIGALPAGGSEVQQEECWVRGSTPSDTWFYQVERGQIVKSQPALVPAGASNRLFLVAASGLLEFRPLYDALSHMGFYNLNPDAIRDLQAPDSGEVLRRDGGNLASVLSSMEKDHPEVKGRIVEFLAHIVPGLQDVSVRHLQKKETLEFTQAGGPSESPWSFFAENMSDGTLRALGVLTALFQSMNGGVQRVPLVGIEEPEAALHPDAAGVLRDALYTAALSTQVVVTSHSPDLLEDKEVQEQSILGVVNIDGETKIGPLDEADRSAIRDRLYTAGELLRFGQLEPDIERINATPARELEVFGETVP